MQPIGSVGNVTPLAPLRAMAPSAPIAQQPSVAGASFRDILADCLARASAAENPAGTLGQIHQAALGAVNELKDLRI